MIFPNRLLLLLLSFLLVRTVGDAAAGGEGGGPLEARRIHEASQIDSFLTKLNKSGYFNGTVLVARNGEPVYFKSFGVSNLKTQEPITNDMPYQMASVSKPVTAAAIMLLVQRGEVNPEDKISKYFPELVYYHRVKVKHLLTHTSGLPEYIYRAKVWWGKDDQFMGNDELIGFLAKKRYRLAFTPGGKYAYCNTNYALLASLVERVTEEKFADFVDREIFEPLGMCHSFIFTPERDSAAASRITSYHWTGRYWKEYGFDYRNGVVGDKGLFSTADDMMKFAMAFHYDWLWCNETCQSIFTKTDVWGAHDSEYGYGWRMREWDSMQVVLHYGFWNSFRTGLIQFPESKVTLVILNNFTGGRGSRVNNRELIIDEIMKVMFPEPTEQPVLADQNEAPADTTDEEMPQEGGGEDSEP